MAKEIAEEYASSLSDLRMNSKPLINMLTILAEENIVHADVIVDTVEKHLEKVEADIKLPVLYLVDSIIKNVGGAYIQKFSQSIVSMFTKTFKLVDEKTRSQMFKLRETWHEVFPSTKMYQLDVKVSLIDPAWPIQAQPQQSSIHFNPSFLKMPSATPPMSPVRSLPPNSEEEKMRIALARKEQELLMLQRKKIEMELEQTKKQLEMAEKTVQKGPSVAPVASRVLPVEGVPVATVPPEQTPAVSVKQRLGPPVNKTPMGARITPVSGAMLSAVRRDPRLARHAPPTVVSQPPQAVVAPTFDVKPMDFKHLDAIKTYKRKNAITIDVEADVGQVPPREPRAPRNRRDPRLDRSKRDFDDRPRRSELRDKSKRSLDSYKKNEDAPYKTRKNHHEKSKTNKTYDDFEEPRKIEEKPLKTTEKIHETVDKEETNNVALNSPKSKKPIEEVLPRFLIADAKMINKLPPIPKLSKLDDSKSPSKKSDSYKKKSSTRSHKRSNKFRDSGKESSDSSSPEKKPSSKENNRFAKSKDPEQTEVPAADITQDDQVSFKELKNYHKEKYMRRNKEKSESPDRSALDKVSVCVPDSAPSTEATKAPEVVENMDVDLRLLPPVIPEVQSTAAPIGHKRHSTEVLETKNAKKHKFDVLFGNEDVDLRQLPQVEDINNTPVSTDDSAISDTTIQTVPSPNVSPKQDWHKVKEKSSPESSKKTPSHLDLVRAKLAEATKGKDRLGRQLLFSNSLDEKEHNQTSDVDLRINTNTADLDPKNDKESIKIIISQAKEQYKDGNMNEEQYHTLMYQVMELNERLKLKEAKQRESLEESKRKLHKANISDEEVETGSFIKKGNNFGDIDERVVPTAFMSVDPFIDPNLPILPHNDVSMPIGQDSDLRHDIGPVMFNNRGPLAPPPMFMGPMNPRWRGPRPREEFNGPRAPRPRPFFHGNFDNRGIRNFEPRMPLPPPPPSLGMCQGDSPFLPYERIENPPFIGSSGVTIPPTDVRLLEYIDRDPMKTIEIDGVPREIRFYGEAAVVILNWDDPREIKFLPGSRRITFDNKDSIVLGFNEDYTTAEVDDQVFKIRFGAPTRELYVNGRWYECYFGGPPCGIIIDGVPRMIQLEGPPPQVTICTEKRTDLVAGKINMIVDAKHMCPVFLDAKPQKCSINNVFFTLRFVDSLKTVLINEVPFRVEFGGMPRPLRIGKRKHFIRFSMAPGYVKPGQILLADMEGMVPVPSDNKSPNEPPTVEPCERPMEVDNNEEPPQFPEKSLSPEAENSNTGGLDMLSSVMPTSLAPASQFSGYSLGSSTDKIPGLDTPADEKPPTVPGIPLFGNINVNDLFAKLVASGIVSTNKPGEKDNKEEAKAEKPAEETKLAPSDNNKSIVKIVDLLKPQSLRVKQHGIVSKLYGGMQCSGCGARFPPERTVRYSQHLDWHFRQNRRERDSARRAHSRHWHYDLSDWVQYEEIEDIEEREKSWFETAGAEGDTEAPAEVAEAEAPSVPAGAPQEQFCALCGDKFDQFYNEDKEEWHLRKAVRHEEQTYHPLCFEDYKASQTKAEEVADDTNGTNDSLTEESSVVIIEKDEEPPIEINDGDDDHSQTDSESVVEVLEDEVPKMAEPVEIEEEEGDEDDVVLKAEPVEEVVVDDDADTDDETQAERAERDKQAEIDFSKIKIKQEPIDPDDEPIITAEEEPVRATIDTTSTTVLSSIDGNVQLDSRNITNPALSTSGIRINISKLPIVVTRQAPEEISAEDMSADEEPLPPGEEPELEFTFKPTLEGVRLSRQPPVTRGMEVSGLCSIM